MRNAGSRFIVGAAGILLFAAEVLARMSDNIRPTAGRRQGQESKTTEDAEEFGITSAW